MEQSYDLIVIGGGPGGYVAAIRGAQHGMKTALIEERQLGGTCLNRGCIPTKALLHSAALYREVLESEDLGLTVSGIGYDMKKMHERKDQVVSELRDGVSALLAANGVSLITGRAKIVAPGTVQVRGDMDGTLQSPHILIATGATPVKPPIPGADLTGVVTSDALLTGVPKDYKRLIVIGGGVIGMEMASLYGNLGAQVTVLEAAERILPHMDREIAQNLSMILKKRGVTIHTGTTVQEMKAVDAGILVSATDKNGKAVLVEGDGVLLAAGRRANLEGLLDDTLELETDRGIVVSDRFETSIPGLYAIGDCVSGSIQLAHVASAQATNAVSIMAGKEAELDLSAIPACVYTDPEIATVGITADEAKKSGRVVKTSKYTMSGNGKSLIEGQERGFVKLVFDGETDVLLGAQLMCGRATDLIGTLVTAAANRLTAEELQAVIMPHPSYGEGIAEAVESLFEKAVHVMPKRKRT